MIPSVESETETGTETSQVIDLNPEESKAFFDAQVESLLGISGDEFLRRWHAGDYDETADLPGNSDIIYLAMMGASDPKNSLIISVCS